MDSVAGIMEATDVTNLNNNVKKFTNIEEIDSDSPKSNPDKEKKTFEYNYVNNDNDNLDMNNKAQRLPITPIIKHYENTNKTNNNSSLSVNSISMKLDPHSSTHLKSFKTYDLDEQRKDQQHLTNSSSNSPTKTNPEAKFNGM